MSLTLLEVKNGFVVQQRFDGSTEYVLWVAPNLNTAIDLMKKIWTDWENKDEG